MAKDLDNVIARQEWLKPVEENVQKAIRGAFNHVSPKVKNFLHGTWLGLRCMSYRQLKRCGVFVGLSLRLPSRSGKALPAFCTASFLHRSM